MRQYRKDVQNGIFQILGKCENPLLIRDIIEAVQQFLKKTGSDTAVRNTVINHMEHYEKLGKILYVDKYGFEEKRSRNCRVITSDRQMFFITKAMDRLMAQTLKATYLYKNDGSDTTPQEKRDIVQSSGISGDLILKYKSHARMKLEADKKKLEVTLGEKYVKNTHSRQ